VLGTDCGRVRGRWHKLGAKWCQPERWLLHKLTKKSVTARSYFFFWSLIAILAAPCTQPTPPVEIGDANIFCGLWCPPSVISDLSFRFWTTGKHRDPTLSPSLSLSHHVCRVLIHSLCCAIYTHAYSLSNCVVVVFVSWHGTYRAARICRATRGWFSAEVSQRGVHTLVVY
jgi:hypothetical protein